MAEKRRTFVHPSGGVLSRAALRPFSRCVRGRHRVCPFALADGRPQYVLAAHIY